MTRYLGVSAGELEPIASDPDRVNDPGRTQRRALAGLLTSAPTERIPDLEIS